MGEANCKLEEVLELELEEVLEVVQGSEVMPELAWEVLLEEIPEVVDMGDMVDMAMGDMATVDMATMDMATVDMATMDMATGDMATMDMALLDMVKVVDIAINFMVVHSFMTRSNKYRNQKKKAWNSVDGVEEWVVDHSKKRGNGNIKRHQHRDLLIKISRLPTRDDRNLIIHPYASMAGLYEERKNIGCTAVLKHKLCTVVCQTVSESVASTLASLILLYIRWSFKKIK